ncbi:MAG: hypothetical protein IJ423_02415 [Clostridia bacterium]|nr:hypothetical protein [Clostridia bacterium]
MKKFKNFVALILIIVLSVSVCACGNQNNEIKTLTKNFENSCNKLDMNAMLDCIDPDISESVKKLTGLIGMFSDKDTDELLDSFAKVLFSELPENSKEFFSSIKIKLDNIEIEEDSASASAEITYEISGEDNKSNANFEYIRIDEKWYISNLDIE